MQSHRDLSDISRMHGARSAHPVRRERVHLAPSWKEDVLLAAPSGFSFADSGDVSPPVTEPAGLPMAGSASAVAVWPTLDPLRITKPARDWDTLVRGRCMAA